MDAMQVYEAVDLMSGPPLLLFFESVADQKRKDVFLWFRFSTGWLTYSGVCPSSF